MHVFFPIFFYFSLLFSIMVVSYLYVGLYFHGPRLFLELRIDRQIYGKLFVASTFTLSTQIRLVRLANHQISFKKYLAIYDSIILI